MDTLEEMYASLMVGGTDKVQAARVNDTGADGSLEDMYAQRVREYDDVLAANPYGCNQYGHEWRGKHGEGWKPSGRSEKESEKKEDSAQSDEKNESKEWKSPHRRPDGSFNIPALDKAIAIPTNMPLQKDMTAREKLIEDTKYRPEWRVRTDVQKEADKALEDLRKQLKKEKIGSERWTKFKEHENSLNGFVSRMKNSATERQRREQMRFMLQYLQHVEKDLKEK